MTKLRKYNIQGHAENTFHLPKFLKKFSIKAPSFNVYKSGAICGFVGIF